MADASALDSLNARFAIAGAVRFEAGSGGLPCAVVTAPAAEGRVYLHGAHVVHHQPAGPRPLLFLSPLSRFAAGAAIRGGVPIVFPWFGARAGHPEAPAHGFARTAEWTIEAVALAGPDAVAVTLVLEPDEAMRRTWPHDFRLRHRVVFGAALDLALEVENRGGEPFRFEAALHTYLLVGDVRRVSVAGLEGAGYIDKADGLRRKVLPAGPLTLDGPTDRVVPGTRATCVVTDPVLGRRLVVDKRGSGTTVLWNPWAGGAAALPDLGPDGWPAMLCVETASVGADAVTLAGGARHAMGAHVTAAVP